MTNKTILEKLKIVFETSKTSKILIIALIFLGILIATSLFINDKNKNKIKIVYILLYTAILATLLIAYHSYLGKMFDYMMNNLFIIIYFPNLAIYFAAIITTNIILCFSIFSDKIPKLIKNINLIIYCIINYLLALVLDVIIKNELDIFSQASIYSNRIAQTLIELSSNIFIVWIVFLILYKIIRTYQLKQQEELPIEKPIIVKKVRIIPATIREISIPKRVKATIKKQKELEQKKVQEELKNQLEFVQKELQEAKENLRIQEEEQKRLQYENNSLSQEKTKLVEQNRVLKEKKVAQEERKIDTTSAIMKNLDQMLTLEDYKILLTILKEQQRKNHDKEILKQQQIEQLKFSSIEESYRNLNY